MCCTASALRVVGYAVQTTLSPITRASLDPRQLNHGSESQSEKETEAERADPSWRCIRERAQYGAEMWRGSTSPGPDTRAGIRESLWQINRKTTVDNI